MPLDRRWMTPRSQDAAAAAGSTERLTTYQRGRRSRTYRTLRLPARFWAALTRGPPEHRIGQGALWRERTDCGRRRGPLPSLDYYDNRAGLARAAIYCNRVWFGWVP